LFQASMVMLPVLDPTLSNAVIAGAFVAMTTAFPADPPSDTANASARATASVVTWDATLTSPPTVPEALAVLAIVGTFLAVTTEPTPAPPSAPATARPDADDVVSAFVWTVSPVPPTDPSSSVVIEPGPAVAQPLRKPVPKSIERVTAQPPVVASTSVTPAAAPSPNPNDEPSA
jgi:hypothetical protein